jgi:hypothetical protein
VNLQDGKPVLSRFLNGSNQNQTVEFLSGSSAMHSVGVKFLPEKNALLNSYCEYAEEKSVWRCKVTAYVWNPAAHAFKLDPKLSKQATQSRREHQDSMDPLGR